MIYSTFYDITQIDQVAQTLHTYLQKYKIITFTGDLGAGKTTLISSLLTKCGVQEIIQSPTFSYVNIYTNNKNQTFYHFDLYRIASLEDFNAAGFAEYLYAPDSWAFIEWPALIAPLFTHDVAHAQIEYEGFDKRKLIISDKLT